MKRRLQRVYWTGVLITLLMAFTAIALIVRLKTEDTREHLTAILQAASRWTLDSDEDFQSLVDSIAGVSDSLRVTFLLENGVVLADSRHDPEDQTFLGDAPEIAAAREGQTGSSLRLSPSDGTVVLYLARRISPQLVLRLGYPVVGALRLLVLYGAVLLLFFLALFLIQRKEIFQWAADMQRQFENIRQLLDGETQEVEAVFPEYRPSMEAIAYRIKRLREDYEEIRKTMQLREDFVANASHELRSPLTSVRGYAEMLYEGMAQSDEEKDLCIRTILNESSRMLDVIEDILHLNRIGQAGNEVTHPVRLAPIAGEVCLALAPQAEKKQITVSCEGDGLLRALEREVWEILFNLTDNAIRYGKTGGTVRIMLEDGRMTVEDNGIGISPDQTGRIFEQFYRIEENKEEQVGGTGLGLSIVKAIVEMRGGAIDVESVQGKGSRFIVTIPEGGTGGEERGSGSV